MKPTTEFSARQERNFEALAKCDREAGVLKRKIEQVFNRRVSAINRIFDEIEKDPSPYKHVVYHGKKRETTPMTPSLVKKLRSQFNEQVLKQQAAPKNPHGGPGCDDCDDIDGCWCAFGAGPLCCYVCASLEVVRCHF